MLRSKLCSSFQDGMRHCMRSVVLNMCRVCSFGMKHGLVLRPDLSPLQTRAWSRKPALGNLTAVTETEFAYLCREMYGIDAVSSLSIFENSNGSAEGRTVCSLKHHPDGHIDSREQRRRKKVSYETRRCQIHIAIGQQEMDHPSTKSTERGPSIAVFCLMIEPVSH